MNSANSQPWPDEIADVVGCARQKGVRLWSENGQLHFKAPKGALTEEEIERLRISREQIVDLLERTGNPEIIESAIRPRGGADRAPLAFSQLAHWHLYRLGQRHGIRQIASATRLHGRINLGALQESLTALLHRHDALRSRIAVLDGEPVQEISESVDCDFAVNDLTEAPESVREIEVKRLIEQLILTPIDVTVGPLLGVRLLKLGATEHVLIVAMEHMISDESSMSILLRELFTAYSQAVRGRVFSLPDIRTRFADYARWQRSAQRSWLVKHGSYWRQFAGSRRSRFPEDRYLQSTTRSGWGAVPIHIGRSLKAELSEWCRLKGTTLVMSALTAYAGLVLRWCDVTESVIQYQFNGRISPQVENTIGFFTSALYLRIELSEDDSFSGLLDRVTEEYCKAYEHADFSYMAAQVPRPDFTRNAGFNWMPEGSKIDLSELEGSEDALTCVPFTFAYPALKKLDLDYEPIVLLGDSDDGVVGGVYFPLNRFSATTMERFGRNFLVFVRTLLRQPEARIRNIDLL